MEKRPLRQRAMGKFLDWVAWNCQTRYEFHLWMSGIDAGAPRVARDVSRVIADEYNEGAVTKLDKERLEYSLKYGAIFP